MEPVLGELGQVAAGLAYGAPRVPWAGALAGELAVEPGPGYWIRQAREPVRFADAVGALAAEGISVFLEIGPDGTLSALGPVVGGDGAVFVPVLRPGQPAAAAVTGALARAHVHGVAVNWAAILTGERVELPTYAFRHQRFWLEPAAGGDGAGSAAEARFWAAVEGGDLEGLSRALAVQDRERVAQMLPVLASWRRRERDRSVTAGWRYQVRWAPVAEPGPGALSGAWLLVVPRGLADGNLAGGCGRVMAAAGTRVITVEAAAGEERATLAARIAGAEVCGVEGVLSLLALDETPVPAHPALAAGLAGTTALVQALGDVRVAAPLWVLTSGAVVAGPGEQGISPVQAGVWGLGRVAGLECPDRWGGLVDVPPVLDDRAGARLCAVLAGCGEDQVAIRASGVLARRLTRAPRPDADRRGWMPGGTVLVTGGTGAIGGHVARWVAEQGAPRVVLANRSGPAAAGGPARVAELAAAGAGVEVVACDTAVREQVAGLVARIGSGGPPLCAVLHAAGVLDDGVLDGLDASRLAGVWAAKAAGAAHLDELTAGLDLEQFVLFSSAAATLGSAGQGNYAAANAFLDALAQRRAARGLAATSVAWGPWAGGMAQSSQAVRQRLRRSALPEMDPGLAVKALGQALADRETLLAVMDVDWAQLAVAPIPFLKDLPEVAQLAPSAAAAAPGPQEASLTARLAGLPLARQVQLLTDLVRTSAAVVLGHDASAIQDGRAFADLGFDSLTSLEMRQHLAAATSLALPATMLFDYPTPAAVAGYLQAQARGPAADPESGPGPVLDELDKLEALLAQIEPGDQRLAQITGRLHALTRRFGTIPELAAATNDEMFQLIEDELRDSDLDLPRRRRTTSM
jgi:acyl transferase domain-containing protein